jgi:D-alanyl-D-alanine carboxypeptidase
MDKAVKFLLNWKVLLPLILLLALALWAAPTLLRKVAPYHPLANRDLSGWGTLSPETAARLQSALDADVNRMGVPGFQAAVRTADGQTWYGVSGTTDPERRIRLRRDHIIRVGSVTKTFTAVVILQLIEEGKLSLDDPLAKWFPDFPNARTITVRDMLTHRSGIFNNLESPMVLGSLFWPRKYWQPQEMVDIAARERSHAQGEYYYSNTNYILLGLIAEQITGQDAATLYRQRILEPLDVKNTFFVPYESAPALQNLISGFDRDLNPLPGLFELTPESVSAATAAYTSGAMASTAEDLMKFYEGLFSGKLLSRASLDAMTTFYDVRDPGTPQITGYGLGLFSLDVAGEEVWASIGFFIGSTTMVAYSPGEKDIVAIIGNLSLYDFVGVWKDLTSISRANSR